MKSAFAWAAATATADSTRKGTRRGFWINHSMLSFCFVQTFKAMTDKGAQQLLLMVLPVLCSAALGMSLPRSLLSFHPMSVSVCLSQLMPAGPSQDLSCSDLQSTFRPAHARPFLGLKIL